MKEVDAEGPRQGFSTFASEELRRIVEAAPGTYTTEAQAMAAERSMTGDISLSARRAVASTAWYDAQVVLGVRWASIGS